MCNCRKKDLNQIIQYVKTHFEYQAGQYILKGKLFEVVFDIRTSRFFYRKFYSLECSHDVSIDDLDMNEFTQMIKFATEDFPSK
jgi:hypothetical protein